MHAVSKGEEAANSVAAHDRLNGVVLLPLLEDGLFLDAGAVERAGNIGLIGLIDIFPVVGQPLGNQEAIPLRAIMLTNFFAASSDEAQSGTR